MGKLAAAKLAKRGALFDQYSRNWNTVKRHPQVRVSPNIDDTYMCPLCPKGFLRDAVADPDHLTLDHIPSEKLGGRIEGAVLLCKDCNNKAGAKLDGPLKRVLDAADFTAAVPGSSVEGWYTLAPGTKMTATIRYDDGGTLQILGDPRRSNPRHRDIENAFLASLPDSDQLTWKMGGSLGKPRLADIALLRYGYLMLFRQFGYGAIVHETMRRVRDQINKPDEQILPYSWVLMDIGYPDESLGVNIITEPSPAQSYLIVFDLLTKRRTRCGVILPKTAYPGLVAYEWFAEQKQASALIELSCAHCPEDPGLLTNPDLAFVAHKLW